MSKPTRLWIILSLLLLVVYLAWTNKAFFYTERHAEKIAIKEFKKYCATRDENPNSFEGPIRVEMGGSALWAFEWKSEKAHKVIGVWLALSGWPTVYSGEE